MSVEQIVETRLLNNLNDESSNNNVGQIVETRLINNLDDENNNNNAEINNNISEAPIIAERDETQLNLELNDDEIAEIFKDENFIPDTQKLIKTLSYAHTIKCSLNSIKKPTIESGPNPSFDLFCFIKEQVVRCTQLTSEAWDLVNYYVIYCLHNDKEVCILNEILFMQCFALLGWCKGARTIINADLQLAFIEFKTKRLNLNINLTKNSGDELRNRGGLDGIFHSIAAQMVVNTNLMLKQFKFRLKKYLNFKFDYGDDKRKRFKSLNNDFLVEYEEYEDYLVNKNENGKFLDTDFTTNSTNLTKLLRKLREIQQEFSVVVAAKLLFYSERQTDQNSKIKNHSTKQKRQIKLKKNEKLSNFEYENKKSYQLKCIKNFSLLPQKSGFGLNYMPISKSSMVDLIAHSRFVNSTYAAKQPAGYVIKPNRSIERRNFLPLESVFYGECTSHLFDFSKVLFPLTSYKSSEISMISTNGHSVCIFFETVKRTSKFKTNKKISNASSKTNSNSEAKTSTHQDQVVIEKLESSRKRRRRLAKTKILKTNETVPSNNKIFQFSKFKKNLLVGIDPGAKTLVTAVAIVEENLVPPDHHFTFKDKNHKKANEIAAPNDKSFEMSQPDKKFQRLKYSYSSKQFYHDSKVNERNRVAKMWLNATAAEYQNLNEKNKKLADLNKQLENLRTSSRKQIKKDILNLRNQVAAINTHNILFRHSLTANHMREKNFKSIKEIIQEMVSNKTGDFIEYNIYLEYKKKHEDVLLKYSTINSSRKWELSTSIAKQQVYEKLYLTFQDCILGYGNYSQPGSSIIRTKSNFFIFKRIFSDALNIFILFYRRSM